MFAQVTLTETIRYYSEYTRAEVITLLTEHGIPLPYNDLPDTALLGAFVMLLNNGSSTATDLVNTRGHSQHEVIATDYTVTGGLVAAMSGGRIND